MDAPVATAAKTDSATAPITDESVAHFFQQGEAAPPAESADAATAAKGSASSEGTTAEAGKTEAPKVETTEAKPTATEQATDDLTDEDKSKYANVIVEAMRHLNNGQRALLKKELEKGYLRHSSMQQEKDRLSKVEKSAQAFDAAMRNPALRKAWHEIMENGASSAEAGEDQDVKDAKELNEAALSGDAERTAAILKRQRERARALAREESERLYNERVVEPQTRFKTVEAALQAHADEEGIDYEAMRDAVRKAQRYPANGPIESWDPAKAVELVTPFLNGSAKKATTSVPAGTTTTGSPLPRVAPPGRGSGAVAPPPMPAHRRVGKKMGELSNSEHAEEMAALLSEQLGIPISVADLERAK